MFGTFPIGHGRCLNVASALAVAMMLATAGQASAATGSSQTDTARCPLKPSSSIPSGEAWAFSVTGPPSSPHQGVASTYTHGRGTWTHGRGGGTICLQASSPGHAPHNLVLDIAGSAHLSTEVTRLGHLGVGLVVNATVGASDDQTCATGTHGNLTLFASYFEGHFDSAQLHFTGGCGAYDYRFSGPQLRVLIARDGQAVR
jgi:hypothetical protein